jgi:hypothetical protein
MQERSWSWVRALESGSLSPTQLESLQAMVDQGEVENLEDAARLLDDELAKRADRDRDL